MKLTAEQFALAAVNSADRLEHEGRLVIGRCPTTGGFALLALDAGFGGQCVTHDPHGNKVAGCGKRLILCKTCGARSRVLDADSLPGPCPMCGRNGDAAHGSLPADRSRFHTAPFDAHARYRR